MDIASLAAFRIGFGVLMAFAMIRFLARGWVRELYVAPVFHFTYPGFAWVRPLPDFWMHALFVLLAVLAVAIAIGWRYRLCVALFFLGFTYVELLDQASYLNHYYFISLVSGLLILLPADRAWSWDAWRHPTRRLDVVPAWCLNLLRFQVGVVYFFAGLAKINADWLLQAQPLRIWLAARSDLPWLGPCISEPWVAYLASWTGALYDLSIPFLLLHRRTRHAAFGAVIAFHVLTALLFNIGMFPWIMMMAAPVFFPADWPRRLLAHFDQIVGTVRPVSAATHPPAPIPVPRWVMPFLATYAALQVTLPLRPYLGGQPAAWSGHGFNLAWQVMIVEKTGFTRFFAEDPTTNRRWRLSVKRYLTSRQEAMMAQDPDLIRAMACRLADDLRRRGHDNIRITAEAYASLNGRPSQLLIRPDLDLTAAGLEDWIVPLAR